MSESGEGRVVVEGDETAVTMLDVLQDEQELEDDANVRSSKSFPSLRGFSSFMCAIPMLQESSAEDCKYYLYIFSSFE